MNTKIIFVVLLFFTISCKKNSNNIVYFPLLVDEENLVETDTFLGNYNFVLTKNDDINACDSFGIDTFSGSTKIVDDYNNLCFYYFTEDDIIPFIVENRINQHQIDFYITPDNIIYNREDNTDNCDSVGFYSNDTIFIKWVYWKGCLGCNCCCTYYKLIGIKKNNNL